MIIGERSRKGEPGKKFLEWMGGFCDLDWSVNPHWKPTFDVLPDHPIANGVKPFSVHDEWYYHMRFVDGMKGVTPVLVICLPQKRFGVLMGQEVGIPRFEGGR